MTTFLAFTIVGIVTGSIYAIAAAGLVVTYTTSGIFNFAHGAIGMVCAFTYWELRVNRGWPAPIAFVVVIFILAPAIGALIERALMRRLEGATVATTLVISLGLLIMFLGAAQGIWDPGEARSLPKFFAGTGFTLAGVNVGVHDVFTIVVGAGVAVGLRYLLNGTRAGIAMRAVVDDRGLTALVGGRPSRISQMSWALGSSMAALAGVLLAPVLQLNAIQLTLLVVNAYAAAMVGRLKSLPLTYAGAFGLGLITSYAIGYIRPSGIFQGLNGAIPTLFLFIALLALPQARLRVGRLVGAKTPHVPDVRRAAAAAAVLVVVATVFAAILSRGNLVRVGQGFSFAIIMLSLVLLTGYAAQVSLCQMTFVGLGAFAMAKLGGGGSPLGLVAAAALAAAVGALVALPSLRLQGLYLALSTMAFAVLMDNMVFTYKDVFGTAGALPVARLAGFGSERSYFVLLAIVFGLLGMFVLWIKRGPFGRLLSAMRDAPAACATLGLSLTRTKLAVFTVSAAMAGVGGAMYGGLRTTAGSNDFIMFQSLPILLLAVIGGITTVSGALLGGMLFALMPVLQEKVPSLGGVVFLLTGFVTVVLGRNPNGLAPLIVDKVSQLVRPERTRRPDDDTIVMEEVRAGAAPG